MITVIISIVVGVVIGVTTVVAIACCKVSGKLSDMEDAEFERWQRELEGKGDSE